MLYFISTKLTFKMLIFEVRQLLTLLLVGILVFVDESAAWCICDVVIAQALRILYSHNYLKNNYNHNKNFKSFFIGLI